MIKRCSNCYHYSDNDGYKKNDCSEPNYNPITMLHNNGYDALPNKPLPKAFVCSKWKSADKIFRIRESKAILDSVVGDLDKMTKKDICKLKRRLKDA